jgi:arginyl-tRNA synthetase
MSIIRKAEQTGIDIKNVSLESLQFLHETERDVILHLNEFPVKLINAAEEYSPAIITQYIYDLAKEYNRFYAEVSIFNEDNETALKFRILMSKLVAEVINRGMKLLGIKVPDRM